MDARREGYRTERYRTGTYVTDHDTDPALPPNCPLWDGASTAAATQIDYRRPVIARLRCPRGEVRPPPPLPWRRWRAPSTSAPNAATSRRAGSAAVRAAGSGTPSLRSGPPPPCRAGERSAPPPHGPSRSLM